MKLKKKRYDKNKKIRIYYFDEFSESLIKYVVNLFLKKDSGKNLILIRARKGREVYKLKLDEQVYYLKKLYKLSEANIPVVKPVAAITWEKESFINDSVLITKELRNTL